MIDTSTLVAALVEGHEHHRLARPYALAAERVPAIVLAETYAQLRRTFGQPAVIAVTVLAPCSPVPTSSIWPETCTTR